MLLRRKETFQLRNAYRSDAVHGTLNAGVSTQANDTPCYSRAHDSSCLHACAVEQHARRTIVRLSRPHPNRPTKSTPSHLAHAIAGTSRAELCATR